MPTGLNLRAARVYTFEAGFNTTPATRALLDKDTLSQQ